MRAMPHGGEIQVQACRSGPTTCIVVRDSGCGIPAEILHRLFEPGVSTKPAGTSGKSAKGVGKAAGGLGLQVVESIVREYGGSVRAANRADAPGAEFTITLAAPSARPAHA